MTKVELEKEIEELKAENKSLWLEKTHAKIDTEYVEDNAFDFAVANQIFWGDETKSMLKRFMEDVYGLKTKEML